MIRKTWGEHMPGVFKFFIKGYNTISEMKYILERINSRLNETENRISYLEDKVEKNIQSEQEMKKEC